MGGERALRAGGPVALVMAALALSGCGAGASSAASQTMGAQPVGSPTAAATPSLEGTSNSAPTASETLAAPSATLAAPSAMAGVSVNDLAGTWKGEILAPGSDPTGMPDPRKDTRWQAKVVLEGCVPGKECGTFSYATADFKGTGKPATCQGAFMYRGLYEDRAAFEFEERIGTTTGATICQPMLAVLTPLASGAALGFEEKKMSWYTHGLLLASSAF